MLDDSQPPIPAAPASRRESPALDEPPIDLVHLARQCQGVEGLEEELLGLFRRLAGAEAARLSDPSMGLLLKANAAHKLRGSALAVGARRVARAAGTIEAFARESGGEPLTREQTAEAARAIAALEAAVAEAIAEIERLRGE
jgi:Hpt domain